MKTSHFKATAVLVLLALAARGPSLCFAAFSGASVGTTGASFLTLSPDARASGMGEAYTASADDASAIQYNPAGLAAVTGMDINLSQTFFLDQINFQFAGFAEPLGKLFHDFQQGAGPSSYEAPPDWGVLGVGILYLNVGSIPSIDKTGTAGGSFSPTDMAVSISYAKTLDALDLGVTLKYIDSTITETATTVAGDLGARYHTDLGDHPVILAAAVRDIGGGLKFIGETDPLPTTISLGGNFSATKDILFEADVNLPEGDAPYVSLGTELSYAPNKDLRASIRLGYDTLDSSSGLGGAAGASAGAGLSFRFFRVDYAWVPFGILGNTNRISLALRF